MMDSPVLVDLSGPVLTLTLNRPEKLNAFTPDMRDALIAALDRADADDAVRAVIVTGAGRGLCAGADMSAGAARFDVASRAASEHGIRDNGGLVSLRLYACLKPVIAAVNGAAVGVGATMLLPMDMRLASTAARFGFPFTKRGLVPEACSSWFLPRAVGMQRAMEWLSTGRVFPAAEALEAGLVRGLHEPDDLLPAARALAEEIAANAAPVSMTLTRQMLWRMQSAAHPMEAHRLESHMLLERGRSPDVAEGVTAFLEKRPAQFAGRVSADMPVLPWTDPGFDEETTR
jgi:enoyl-CoA hydratase/carnithine racemase